MNSSEDIHDLTQTIYRNLSEHFSPAVRQILSCAKAYHKSLLAASTTARAFIESLGRLGHQCRNSCQGGTEELGEAIFRIAEIQKEIQLKFEDCNKALFAEVVIPLEQKLDNDFKNAAAEQKKYSGGHKSVFVPYVKAMEAHRKFLKKQNRARVPVLDDEKEMTLKRSLERCRSKLDEYRLQGLKLALLEERRCYCYIVARLSAVSTTHYYHHDRGAELLRTELSRWKQLCSQPNILPRSADPLLRIMPDSSSTYTVYTPNDGGHSPYRTLSSPPDVHQSPDYAMPVSIASTSSDTIPRSVVTMMSQPPSQPPSGPAGEVQMRALYTHLGGQGSQMTFTPGDLITPVGDPADGWQFGHNLRTGQYGWFPLSFTDVPEPRRPLQAQTPLRYRQRAKSFSELNGEARALAEMGGWPPDLYNVPGTQSRPRSLHEASFFTASNLPQLLEQTVEGSYYSATNPALLAPTPSAIYILGTRSQPVSRSPSPPPPPPPATQHVRGDGVGPASALPLASTLPPAMSRHPSMPRSGPPAHTLPMPARGPSQSRFPGRGPPVNAPPPPAYPPPSVPPRPPPQASSFLSSQHNVVVQSQSSPDQSAASSLQVTSDTEHYQTSDPPAPPPPPPPPPPPLPPTSGTDGTFSNVTLRKTKTNDRSAPRIQ